MKRILLFSGKGGVGKTTSASATAVAAARRGHRTLLLSLDLAHSLADAFGLERSLFDQAGGQTTPVAPGLEIQEIDVQAEIESCWREDGDVFSVLLAASGVEGAGAAELALMPGMEDLITLLHISRHAHDDQYDLMVIDCPPTGDSLRFASLPRTIDWYLRKRFGLGDVSLATVAQAARAPATLLDLRRALSGAEKLLHSPDFTSVRLVTQPEKVVIRESQRAFMYFSMFGLVVDRIIINRVFPAELADWRRSQEPALERLRELFTPLPMVEVPFLREEVVGLDRLHAFADLIYGDSDPTAVVITNPVFRLEQVKTIQRLVVAMPFIERGELELNREDDCLIVRVGSFKRHLPLPQALQHATIVAARVQEGELIVEFANDSRQTSAFGAH